MIKERKPSMTAFVKAVVAEFISALSVPGVPTEFFKNIEKPLTARGGCCRLKYWGTKLLQKRAAYETDV